MDDENMNVDSDHEINERERVNREVTKWILDSEKFAEVLAARIPANLQSFIGDWEGGDLQNQGAIEILKQPASFMHSPNKRGFVHGILKNLFRSLWRQALARKRIVEELLDDNDA